MSFPQWLHLADVEVWERADGTWNWVMFFRPDVNQPAFPMWDSTPHASAREALTQAELQLQLWALLGLKPWLL